MGTTTTNMIITELPRTPTRFVFISNLVSPSSAHLNGELAWLGKWKPERQRFGLTPCDSDNVNVTRYEVAVKEANIEDTTDDEVVAFVLERLNDASLPNDFSARLGRLDFLLDAGRVGDDLPETLLAPLAEATESMIKQTI